MTNAKAVGPCLLAALTAWAVVGVASSQPPEPPKFDALAGRVEGVGECKICHSGANQNGIRDYTDEKGGIRSQHFIRLDESVTWEEKDPHSKAFAVLRSDMGKTMGEKLKYDVTAATQCLSCHATDRHQRGKPIDEMFIRGDKVGVGCVACHDVPNAVVKKTWRNEHYEIKANGVEWRTFTPDQKTTAGMCNLRDPVTKANLCASCHVGNSDEGKVVTHEMYVAGHPPLPPFELLTFMEDEPRHGGTPFDPDLKFFHTLDTASAKRFSFHPADGAKGYATRHFAAGAVAALKSEVATMKAEADATIAQGKLTGLDYARFDCYACHHPLKLPSERQARGYDAAPGRPPVKAWVGAMAKVVAERAGDKTFDGVWNTFTSAATAKPYGDPKRVSDAAQPLLTWCEKFEETVRTSDAFGPAGADALHSSIKTCLQRDHAAADPEAAMALAWAYRSLHEPVTGKPAALPSEISFPFHVRNTPYFETKDGKPTPRTAGAVGPERLRKMYQIDAKHLGELFPKGK